MIPQPDTDVRRANLVGLLVLFVLVFLAVLALLFLASEAACVQIASTTMDRVTAVTSSVETVCKTS